MSAEWTSASLFLRQVHPNHCTGSDPNSLAFFPAPKDHDRLSVDDASIVTADQAWSHFTEKLGFESAGTWAVSLGEIYQAGSLKVTKDPAVDLTDVARNNPAHCLVDFSALTSKGQKKKRAQQLAINASARGCLFRPDN